MLALAATAAQAPRRNEAFETTIRFSGPMGQEMKKPVIRLAKEIPASASPDVRIKVANFGPIADAAVDLRPLTVFVGSGNAGKTCLATLIYALHKALDGFPRFPPITKHFYDVAKGMRISDAETADIISNAELVKRPFLFSDLPEIAQKIAQRVLRDPSYLAMELKEELERCFDLKDVADLTGSSAKSGKMDISLMVESGGKELWNLSMGVSDPGIMADGKINDMVLVPEPASMDEEFFRMSRKSLSYNDKDKIVSCLANFLEMLPRYAGREEYPEIHYLPAARNGVIQSHRAIASSLVAGSTRAGSKRFPASPAFSGVTADFLQRLILYDAAGPYARHRPRGRPSKALQDLADALERKTLDGRIMTIAEAPGGYPEFVYKPRNARKS